VFCAVGGSFKFNALNIFMILLKISWILNFFGDTIRLQSNQTNNNHLSITASLNPAKPNYIAILIEKPPIHNGNFLGVPRVTGSTAFQNILIEASNGP